MKKNKELKGWLIAISSGLILGILIQVFFQVNLVNGNSMNPTLKNREMFVSLKTNWTQLNRGDIVDINSRSLDYVNTDMLVKRIVGLPGETVVWDNGNVFINEEKLEETYKWDELKDRKNNNKISITLKSDEYFVLGDNRNNSTDSRIIGPIKEKFITSKYLFSFWK